MVSNDATSGSFRLTVIVLTDSDCPPPYDAGCPIVAAGKLVATDPQGLEATQMPVEPVDTLQSFRAFIAAAEQGATIPAVDEHDLKSLHELCVERAKRYCGKDGVISIEMTARACSPGANLPAVWLRHTQLRSLYREGLLSKWQHGAVVDDAVFQLAATIPMTGTRIDHNTFLQALRAAKPD